jgi:hypothetical protein
MYVALHDDIKAPVDALILRRQYSVYALQSLFGGVCLHCRPICVVASRKQNGVT